MDLRLNDTQAAAHERAKFFASEWIAPVAKAIDALGAIPASLLQTPQMRGWLGAALPPAWGGGGMDPLSYGLATEELGKACSSVRSLMTAHNMAAQALARFGTEEQKARWLPELCAGTKIIAFALTEPDVGSAASAITANALELATSYRVTGEKIWITAGLLADLYLVFVNCDGEPMALVVERDTEGFTREPMTGTLGVRGAMLARLRFDGMEVAKSHRIGAVGAGIAFVANVALDHGRFSVAWGATGVVHACLDASVAYAAQRQQAGQVLSDFQLVRRLLTDMLVAHTTARALCSRSAFLRMTGNPRAVLETTMAKYHAAGAAVRAAEDSVRLHGANGYGTDYPVERYLRDATVLEIIEGTRESHQVGLASYALQWPHAQY